MKKKSGAVKPIRELADLTLDPKNANKGTEKGRKMVAESLNRYGAGRSILVDREGHVWVSEIFEADTHHHVKQGVFAGFLMGHARLAETEAGELIFGLDAKGNIVR